MRPAVTAASSCDEALAGLDEWVVLVVTDLAMPGRSGLELITELRARRPELPIIAMSGNVLALGEASRAGADAALTDAALVSDDYAVDILAYPDGGVAVGAEDEVPAAVDESTRRLIAETAAAAVANVAAIVAAVEARPLDCCARRSMPFTAEQRASRWALAADARPPVLARDS